ncbi:MAG TPA: methyltransferase domain-containing protein [Terriglobales bacterium]|nr:methyltransferase domain-containing protein [Terriglobales bacterium]
MTTQEQRQQGIDLYNAGKFKEAVQTFSILLEANGSSEVWNDWATAQVGAGELGEATRGYKKALQIDPNNQHASRNLTMLVEGVAAHEQSQKKSKNDALLMNAEMTDEMKRNWDFVEKRQLLFALVGFDFGKEPETKLDEIREYKRRESAFFLNTLKPNKDDVMVDLGSGCGFIARVMAPLCKQLYCLDISNEFLRFAREELQQFNNVGFHRMSYGDLHYLDDKKITKGYANAVFIHFNFFDVVMYLQEIYRVLAPGGLFMFGLSNTDCLDLRGDRYFSMVMADYVKQRSSIATLMQWNSSRGVCSAARQIGFEATELWAAQGSAMILVRKA